MTTYEPTDSGNPLSEDLLPIREVARQTGVNPVTLRAWERRYGLILPQRTAKGHRLYSTEQIAQIHQVLGWLERGVAVSQVKRLLQDSPQPLVPANSLWGDQQQQWLHCIDQLAERALDDSFNQALALYPSETLCRHLLLPLLEHLQQRWSLQPKARLEQVFFLSWLRTKLGARLYHGNRLQGGAPLLLLNLSDRAMEPGLWLCAWLASNAGCPVQVLDWPIPATELTRAIQQIHPRAVLLYGDQSLDPEYLQRVLGAVSGPQLLCGRAVSIHQEALADFPDLHLADDPLAALHCLQRLGLLTGR